MLQKHVILVNNLYEITNYFKKNLFEYDVIIGMGAGLV